jgi:transcriptional regulator with XRE-family HTH domain
MMAIRKFAQKIIDSLADEGKGGVGVELGRVCLKHGYTVAEVSDVFAVSRPTVYNWFSGKTKPSRRMGEKIQKLIDRLNAKHAENE